MNLYGPIQLLNEQTNGYINCKTTTTLNQVYRLVVRKPVGALVVNVQ